MEFAANYSLELFGQLMTPVWLRLGGIFFARPPDFPGSSTGATSNGARTALRSRVRTTVRTLVISDIHGNWPALKAVSERKFDRVIVLGDLVGYGPFPAQCVDWVREHAEVVVQGNHDRAYAENVPARCRADFRWLSDAVAPLTWRSLDAERLFYLGALPRWAVMEIDGRKFAFVHAAPTSPLYEYIGPDPRRWKAELRGLPVDVLVVGHTHLQFALMLEACEVVNPGSVGQPKDGDPSAAFLIIDDGVCVLDRAAYPVGETIEALEDEGVEKTAAHVLSELLRTGTIPDSAARAGAGELPAEGPPPRVYPSPDQKRNNVASRDSSVDANDDVRADA